MTMTERRHLELMHAVLDGEASLDEARELDRILASDPVARSHFGELRALFEHLSRVPKVHPPEGLVHSILTGAQPFWQSPVSRLQSHPFRGREAARPTSGDTIMSQQPKNGNVTKRNIWIGLGLTAAGVILVGHYAFEIPSGSQDATGTISPAQRYRAPQIQSKDVKLGDQTVAQAMQTDVYQRLAKDAEFRALAQSAAFQALAQNPAALAALAQNSQAFAALAQNPAAFAAVAQNPQAFAALAQNPSAFAAMAQNPQAFAVMAQNSQAFAALAQNSSAFAALAQSSAAMQALSQNSSAFAAMAAQPPALPPMAPNPHAFPPLPHHPQALP